MRPQKYAKFLLFLQRKEEGKKEEEEERVLKCFVSML